MSVVILEHAILHVSAGRERAFEDSMIAALELIRSAPDCHGADVRRQEENPLIYLLTVSWSSIEAHETFRTTPLFEQWRSMTHPFYSEAANVTHFHEPLSPS